MLKHCFAYALVAVLFISVATQERKTQPRQPNTKPKEQNTNTQPVSTPVNNSSSQINNAAEAEREREQKERDAKDDAFKAEQLRQNEIVANATFWMAVFAGINLLVAVAYAIFAALTLRAVKAQSHHAGEQVKKMQGQLEVMNKQAEAAKIAAEAAQKSVDVAERSLIVSMRPYVEVGARLKTFELDRQAEIELILFNEGNSIAENVFINYTMTITDLPGLPTAKEFFKTAPIKVLPHKAMPILVFSKIMWEQPYNAIRYGPAKFFCFGNGSYSGLGGTYPLEFCFVYRKETRALGNCADLEVQGKKQGPT